MFVLALVQELDDAPKDPVIGSDEETAIRMAAKSVCQTSSLIACSRYLKNNMKMYLRDKVGAATRTRNSIILAVFGPGGLTSSSTTAILRPSWADAFNPNPDRKKVITQKKVGRWNFMFIGLWNRSVIVWGSFRRCRVGGRLWSDGGTKQVLRVFLRLKQMRVVKKEHKDGL